MSQFPGNSDRLTFTCRADRAAGAPPRLTDRIRRAISLTRHQVAAIRWQQLAGNNGTVNDTSMTIVFRWLAWQVRRFFAPRFYLYRHLGELHQQRIPGWLPALCLLLLASVTGYALWYGTQARQQTVQAAAAVSAAEQLLAQQRIANALLLAQNLEYAAASAESTAAFSEALNSAGEFDSAAPELSADGRIALARHIRTLQREVQAVTARQHDIQRIRETDIAVTEAGAYLAENLPVTRPARVLETVTRLRSQLNELHLQHERTKSELRSAVARSRRTAEEATGLELQLAAALDTQPVETAPASGLPDADTMAWIETQLGEAQTVQARMDAEILLLRGREQALLNRVNELEASGVQALDQLAVASAEAEQRMRDMVTYLGLSSAKLAPQIRVLKSSGHSIDGKRLPFPSLAPAPGVLPQPVQDQQTPAGETVTDDGATGQGGPLIPLADDDAPLPGADPRLDLAATKVRGHLETVRYYTLLMSHLPLGRPVQGDDARFTSGFGPRSDPFGRGKRAMHYGIDYAGDIGLPILATGDGTVIYAGRKGSFGKFIEIEHISGIVTRYAHLNSISVKVGQKVKRGQKIAGLGNTGRSTGPHLHYEIRINGKRYDPVRFIKVGYNVH